MPLPTQLVAAAIMDRGPLGPETNTISVAGVVFLVLLVVIAATLFVRLARIERNTRPK